MEVSICEHLLADGEMVGKRRLDEDDASALLILRDAIATKFPRKKYSLQSIFQRKRWVEKTALELNMDDGTAERQLLDHGFKQTDVDVFKQLGKIALERVMQSPPHKRPKVDDVGIDETEEKVHMLVDLHCEIERKCAIANKAMFALMQGQQEVESMMQEIVRLLETEITTSSSSPLQGEKITQTI